MELSDALKIAEDIRQTYFNEIKGIDIVFMPMDKKDVLGVASYAFKVIKLSYALLYEHNKYLRQVIYHEFLHFKYVGLKHHGKFRDAELSNPFRLSSSSCCRFVS